MAAVAAGSVTITNADLLLVAVLTQHPRLTFEPGYNFKRADYSAGACRNLTAPAGAAAHRRHKTAQPQRIGDHEDR